MSERYTGFNSKIEIGTRVALILSALDSKISLDEIVMLDYALLYSEEFGGPSNLHPALPNHVAEIAHRREFMPGAIRFLLKRGLIDLIVEKTGHYYSKNENTIDFIACLQSDYFKKSWIRLNWLSDNKSKIVKTKIIELVKSAS
jgi:hypothetical protein